MNKFTKIFLIALLLSAIRYPLTASYAAVPHLINYQGRLTDSAGSPLNGSYNLTFRIYDAEAARTGNLLWQGTYSNVTVTKGIFNILLGDISDAGFNFVNLAFDKPYFLEIKVGSEVMSPRQRITSAGYALRAEKAESADQATNAATVGNVGVSVTPTANKLLPLDANAKLPAAALKVYDSGWFAVSANSVYTKSHNLGTTKLLVLAYSASNSSGAGMQLEDTVPANFAGIQTFNITTTQLSIFIQNVGVQYIPNLRNPTTTPYARVIAIALE